MSSSRGENRIHLGCGYVYRPEYINIDRYETSVTDVLTDASDLPFRPNCIDRIETSQLIEHFDYVNAKQVLSECFRILGHNGELIIETPDLIESIEKISDSDVKTQQMMLSWIFGIDSPGLSHKSGFSFELLKTLLREIGFVQIKREKMLSLPHEPAMKISCVKPQECLEKQILSTLRGKLRQKIGLKDSITLIPLDDVLIEIDKSIGDVRALSEGRLNHVIARTIIANPDISMIFLEVLMENGIIDESMASEKMKLVRRFSSVSLHHRIFTLWMKSKKGDVLEDSFKLFMERMCKSIYEIMSSPEIEKKRIDYLLTLEPTAIPILHYYTLLLEAKKSLNLGIKEFHRGKTDDAMMHLSRSIKINCENPIAHWNLGRLRIINGSERSSVIREYEIALKYTGGSDKRKLINDELKRFIGGKLDSIERVPIYE